MGWNSANEIVEPQIRMMVQAVENEDMSPALASTMLEALIATCQDGDWDTESETLEEFVHVPWVVRAFKEKGVTLTDGERPDRDQVKRAVRATIDANVDSWYDLSEDFARNIHADAITDVVLALFPEDDD